MTFTHMVRTDGLRVGVPIRGSHKLIEEVYFSVVGQNGDGSEMSTPGHGGIQKMRRAFDVVLPQVSATLSFMSD